LEDDANPERDEAEEIVEMPRRRARRPGGDIGEREADDDADDRDAAVPEDGLDPFRRLSPMPSASVIRTLLLYTDPR